jgi:hypothetical protein
MNILDLGPAEFLAALDELGIVGEQRDVLVSQYTDPSRGYERDERPFLTRLADNVIGFDDGVETQGERIGQGARTFFDAVRSDPLGTAGGMISGLYGEIERGVRGELSPTETLGLAPVVGLGSAAARRVEDVVDAAQRAEEVRFALRNENPSFPGGPFATTPGREIGFYHPNENELLQIEFSPTSTQQRFSDTRDKADALLAGGADRLTTAMRTGILSIPRRTLVGDEFADRQILAAEFGALPQLRPSRWYDYGAQRVDDPDLPAGEGYAYIEPGELPQIAQSPSTDPSTRAAIDRHEMTHLDLAYGDVPWEEVGSSPTVMAGARLDALDDLNRRIRAADTPEERQRLMEQREEVRRATSFELYQRNPGEMLARLAEGDPTTSVALSLTEVLNPYIRGPDVGFGRRTAEAVTQGLFGERSGILSIPATRAMDYFGAPVNPRMYYDRHISVPMDLDRAIFNDPNTP